MSFTLKKENMVILGTGSIDANKAPLFLRVYVG